MPKSILIVFTSATLCVSPAKAQQEITPTGRVSRNVVIRADPSTTTQALGALLPGETIVSDEDVSGWYRVVLPNGLRGWVSKIWTDPTTALSVGPAQGVSRMHVIDVGTGLAVFIEGPGYAMLFDGGTQDDQATGDDNRIVAYLKAVRPDLRVIDHLFLSHPHEDHQQLLPDIFDRFEVQNVWDSGRVQQTTGYCKFLRKTAAERGAVYHAAVPDAQPHIVTFHAGSCAGTVRIDRVSAMTASPVSLGAGMSFSVLNRDSRPHSDPNGNSLVVRLDLGSRRLLLTGDAEGGEREPPGALPSVRSIEGRLVREQPADLRVDVLVVGHHGGETSSRRAFLDEVRASTFIISSGPHKYSGVALPDQTIWNELKLRGRVMSTTEGDTECPTAASKIGKDRDNRPGGCTNIVVTVGPGNQLNASYRTQGD